jgi:hypothetical protein
MAKILSITQASSDMFCVEFDAPVDLSPNGIFATAPDRVWYVPVGLWEGNKKVKERDVMDIYMHVTRILEKQKEQEND